MPLATLGDIGARASRATAGDSGGDFFSNFASGIGDAFGDFTRKVLPIWAGQQLLDQQSDPLFAPLFDPRFALPSLNSGSASGAQTTAGQPGGVTSFLADNKVPIIIGVAVLGGLLLLRR